MNLTQEEYEQLRAIKVLYPWARWVARDKDGYSGLYLYMEQPTKLDNQYDKSLLSLCLDIPNRLLPSLTWESEPLNIDEALEGKGFELDHTKQLEACIKDLIFAYVNKDPEWPHDFEVSALKEAYVLFPQDEFIKGIYEDTCSNTSHRSNCGRRLEANNDQ